ncbi:hypothetical protein RZS08_52435, partial [Arthrospira platensis SPKY1]|nr:hypothetical protein [Arthrospira platensis SPKY1]
ARRRDVPPQHDGAPDQQGSRRREGAGCQDNETLENAGSEQHPSGRRRSHGHGEREQGGENQKHGHIARIAHGAEPLVPP